MQEKHIPLRKCIGCGEMIGKKGSVRIVRSKEGELSVDLTGKSPDVARISAVTGTAWSLRKRAGSWNAD